MIDTSLKAMGKQKLRNRGVLWMTDNLGATSVVRKGSMKPDLNKLATEIDKTCRDYGIDLELRWVRRNENVEADKLSRFIDLDDWGVSDVLFQSVNKSWGPMTVDRFASERNNKLPRFNSRFWCEGTEAVDAFSQDWGGEMNWLVPPPILVSKTIKAICDMRAKAVLVCPAWNSSPFWPILFPSGKKAVFVTDFYTVQEGAKHIVPGLQPNSIFTPRKFKGALLVVRLDGSLPP